MLTANQKVPSEGWRVDSRRMLYVALAASVIGACNVGGRFLSWQFTPGTDLYGKTLLGLCMVVLPLYHPRWGSKEKLNARQVIADICIAWLIGLGRRARTTSLAFREVFFSPTSRCWPSPPSCAVHSHRNFWCSRRNDF